MISRPRIALAIAALAAVMLGAGAFAWRVASLLGGQRREMLAAVGDSLGVPVEAASIEIGWFPPGLVARAVRVPDASPYGPGTLASADEARFAISVIDLLRGRLVVDEVALASPVLRAVRGADGGWNLRRRPSAPALAGGLPRFDRLHPRVSVDRVRVRGGRLTYRDRAVPGVGELDLRDVDLAIAEGSGGTSVRFRASGLGGGGSIEGTLEVPRGGDADARVALAISGKGLAAGSLGEVVALLRGRLPFGAVLDGVVSARATATMPPSWPPAPAEVAVSLDAADATVRTVGGWIAKDPGTPLSAEARLVATPDRLAVESASVRVAGGELHLDAVGAAPADGGAQRPLAVALRDIGADRLADWFPALAALAPAGRLSADGRLEPGRRLDGEIELRGEELRLSPGGVSLDLGGSRLALSFDEDASRLGGVVAVREVRGAEGRIGGIEAKFAGTADRLSLAVTAGAGEVRGAPVEGLAVDCLLGGQGIEVRTARARALGGEIAAGGRLSRLARGGWDIVVDPRLDGVDLGGLLDLAGVARGAEGALGGDASLRGSGEDLVGILRTAAGRFDLELRSGRIAANPAATVLAGLRAVPRLRDAVERRSRERVPALLAESTEVAMLRATGTLADGDVRFAKLELEAPDYRVEASGRVGFDGESDLSGVLTLGPAATRALVDDDAAAILAGDDGAVRIPVNLRGTWPRLAGAPTADFVGRLMARAVGGAGSEGTVDWLRRVLGGRGGRSAAGAGER